MILERHSAVEGSFLFWGRVLDRKIILINNRVLMRDIGTSNFKKNAIE